MALRPLHDRVLAKRIREEDQIKGIIIPDTAKEKPQQAEVVAVGNGKRLANGEVVPLEVRIGDRVIFGRYAGSEVVIEDDEYVVLKEDEVFAIVETAPGKRKAA